MSVEMYKEFNLYPCACINSLKLYEAVDMGEAIALRISKEFYLIFDKDSDANGIRAKNVLDTSAIEYPRVPAGKLIRLITE